MKLEYNEDIENMLLVVAIVGSVIHGVWFLFWMGFL